MTYASILSHMVPDQAGALWIMALVWFVLVADHHRLLSRRNLALVVLLVPALSQFDIMLWEGRRSDPATGWLLGTAFACLFGATALMMAWSLVLAFSRARWPWAANVSPRALVVVVMLLTALNAVVILGSKPEDAGYYTNLGARRWMETGTLPYGDQKLRGPEAPGHGAAATYGPMLYVAHLPFQYAVGAVDNPADADPRTPAYVRPPDLATQLTCLAFHLTGLLALYFLGRRLASADVGLLLVALYASSAYLLGLGSDEALSCGLVYVSHVAPSAVTLLALLGARRPWLSGALLALAAGLLFYPALFAPLFLGWYRGRGRGALGFGIGFAATGAATVALVVACTAGTEQSGPIGLFLQSTLEHQEGPRDSEYGRSLFGVWGTHPELAATFQRPLFGSTSLFKPTFLLVAAFAVAGFFLARRRTLGQLALLVAATAAAAQLWKTHAGGTYVMWYLPFLLTGLLTGGGDDVVASDVVDVAELEA